MKNEYQIQNEKGDIIFSLNWFNSSSREEIVPKIENYIHENIVYVLLLLRDIKMDDPDLIDSTEIIEEDIILFDENILMAINQNHLLDIDTMLQIKDKFTDWKNPYRLEGLADLANIVLTKMNIPTDLHAIDYERDHMDMDFLF